MNKPSDVIGRMRKRFRDLTQYLPDGRSVYATRPAPVPVGDSPAAPAMRERRPLPQDRRRDIGREAQSEAYRDIRDRHLRSRLHEEIMIPSRAVRRLDARPHDRAREGRA